MSATTPPERHNPKAWANYGCKDTIIFGEMQEKSHFGAIFLVDGGILAGGSSKRTPKRHERFGDPAEQDSQEEGER